MLNQIADKQSLEAAFREWCHQDTNVDDLLPVYLQLAEDRINEHLRITEMEASVYRESAEQRVGLPTDFLEQRRLYSVRPTSQRFGYLPPSQFYDNASLSSEGGETMAFTIEGTWFVVGFVPQEPVTYQLHYYRRWPRLVADTDNNWLLANNAGIYLFSMLLEQATENEDIGAMGKWEARFVSALNSADRRARNGRYPAGKRTLRSSVRGP